MPSQAENDARHLATATVHGVDVLVSWNLRHLVNIRVRRLTAAVDIKFGYRPVEIVTPEEVMAGGEMGD